ncbi:MAG: hypothetical protein NUW24_08335 [Anaerolineae bacterium]|jgi:hypothetical protein|nr:hypothetical protein [Anaerolineae bacterium]MDH7473457.1 hypothetical protein [Anaerolineae bacterium]
MIPEQSGVALAESELVLTPNGIPVSLRPYFQEYTLEKLDAERDAFTIIERTLAFGCQPEVRWLFARYGRERVREWVRQAGSALLSRRRFRLWVNYLDIRDYHRRRHGAWPY